MKKLWTVSVLVLATPLVFAAKPTLLKCSHTNKHNIQCQYQATMNGRKSMLYAQTGMPYALCSKALCKPSSNGIVTCTCPVYGKKWQGASVGPKSFSASRPTYKHGKLTSVTSNFSMANLSNTSVKPTVCSANKKLPWANCFGIRCSVSYKSGRSQATCRCPVAMNKSFISVGPKNSKACGQGDLVWSGALESQSQSNGVIIPYMYKTYFNKK